MKGLCIAHCTSLLIFVGMKFVLHEQTTKPLCSDDPTVTDTIYVYVCRGEKEICKHVAKHLGNWDKLVQYRLNPLS